MSVGRFMHAATLLQDGSVLIIGGSTDANVVALDSTEVYRPTPDSASPSGTFTPFALMNVAHNLHTATRLPDGRVLVAGGQYGLPTAEIYCGLRSVPGLQYSIQPCHICPPISGTQNVVQQYFVATENDMAVPRAGHSETTLQNGQILIAGGFNQTTGPISEAELFDPKTLTFSVTGSLLTPRAYHIAVVPAAPGCEAR